MNIRPQIRISTVILLLTVVAVALAWYVDYRAPLRSRILGTWQSRSAKDDRVIDLHFKPNGWFRYAHKGLTITGTYEVDESVQSLMMVELQRIERAGSFSGHEIPKHGNLVLLHAAIDRRGRLLLVDAGHDTRDWEFVAPTIYERVPPKTR